MTENNIPEAVDVIPMTIAAIREHAIRTESRLLGRDEFGTRKYGKPLRTFDGRNTLEDAIEETLDHLNYLVKLRHEWGEIADLLERAAEVTIDLVSNARVFGMQSDRAHDTVAELRETVAKMRQDIARVGDASYRSPAERLAAMDAGGGE